MSGNSDTGAVIRFIYINICSRKCFAQWKQKTETLAIE